MATNGQGQGKMWALGKKVGARVCWQQEKQEINEKSRKLGKKLVVWKDGNYKNGIPSQKHNLPLKMQEGNCVL